MPSHDEIEKDIERLKQAQLAALDIGDYGLAETLKQAVEELREWRENDMPGSPPVDVTSLLGESGPPQAEVTSQAEMPPSAPGEEVAGESDPPVPPEARPAVPEPAVSRPADASLSEDDRGLRQQLDSAKRKLDAGDFNDALADLDAVMDQTQDPGLAREARQMRDQARDLHSQGLDDLVQQAQRAEREETNNLDRQQRDWEKVLAVRPGYPDAQEALSRLEQRKRQEEWRSQIRRLRAVLGESSKQISQVEEARLKASNLRDSGQISEPEIQKELEDVFRQLDALRDDMLRAGEGGTSAERDGDFEKAMAVFRTALLNGYAEIVDDVSGERINTQESLTRAQQAYSKDLLGRVGSRYKDAEKSLRDGYPETAVGLLNECTDLLEKVYQGGQEVRGQVEELTGRAKKAKRDKDRARKLVTDSQSEPDPEQGRRLLVEAQQLYPGYPELGQMLAEKERQILAKVVRDIAIDLSTARGLLSRHNEGRFDQAREMCRQAGQRGSFLSQSSPDLEHKRAETQVLLDTIGTEEQSYRDLTARLTPIDEALETPDPRMAKLLLDEFSSEEMQHPEVSRRRQQLTLLQGDDQKFTEADRLFFEDRNYGSAVELCDALSKSPSFKDKALALKHRALARDWLADAEAAFQSGDLDQATSSYQMVASMGGDLPPGDQSLVAQASQATQDLKQQQARKKRLEQQLNKAMKLRRGSQPAWEKWHQQVKDLEAESPEWLQSVVEKEMQEGVADWQGTALPEAQTLLRSGEASEAFQVLDPLANLGLLDENDEIWREIRYQHYRAETERCLLGSDRESWRQAEEMAHRAHRGAPSSHLREATAFLWDTVGQSTLKDASMDAVSSNPGPRGAVGLLQAKMKEYPVLQNHVQMRSRLMRYLLDLGEFDMALGEAQIMKYIEAEQKHAVHWAELVSAVKAYADGIRPQAIRTLANLEAAVEREELSEWFHDLLDYAVGRTLASLRKAVNPEAPATVQVQSLDLILQLNPKDSSAKTELDDFSCQLEPMVRPLRDRCDEFRMGSSLIESVATAEEMLAELQSLRRALTLVEPESKEIHWLEKSEKQLDGELQQWREAVEELARLEENWVECVSKHWDTHKIRISLDRIQRLLRSLVQVDETKRWPDRVSRLELQIPKFTELLEEIQSAWTLEAFDQVIDGVGSLEARLRQAGNDLQESRLRIPEGKTICYDTFRAQSPTDLASVRSWAKDKKRNLERWQNWQIPFLASFNRHTQLGQDIEQNLSSSPACLSKPLAWLGELEVEGTQLLAQLEDQPEAPISNKAGQIANKAPRSTLVVEIQKNLDNLTAIRKDTQTRLGQVQEPLDRLHQFAQRTVLSNKNNRNTIRKMIESVREIDACHPDVEQYEEILKRYEK